jgi:hypothetical protein
MGNDVSSRTARTLIPLDDTACWQLYNGVNEQSEPISIFVSKQTFSVECRRSIQVEYNDYFTLIKSERFSFYLVFKKCSSSKSN